MKGGNILVAAEERWLAEGDIITKVAEPENALINE